MKTTAFVLVGNVLIIVHSEAPPSDEEWEAYVSVIRSVKDLSKLRCIAFTDGGAPNSSQRKLLNEALKNRPLQAAAVSSSTLVRGVVTALNWFNPLVRAFAPERLGEAYQYLKLSREEVSAVNKAISALQKELGISLRCLNNIRVA